MCCAKIDGVHGTPPRGHCCFPTSGATSLHTRCKGLRGHISPQRVGALSASGGQPWLNRQWRASVTPGPGANWNDESLKQLLNRFVLLEALAHRVAGRSWKEIAEKTKLSARTIRRLIAGTFDAKPSQITPRSASTLATELLDDIERLLTPGVSDP